jgi:hypothetical protein
MAAYNNFEFKHYDLINTVLHPTMYQEKHFTSTL